MATHIGPEEHRKLEQHVYEMALNCFEPMTLSDVISSQDRWLGEDTSISISDHGRFLMATITRGNSKAMGSIIANYYETPMPHEDRARKIKQTIKDFGEAMLYAQK